MAAKHMRAGDEDILKSLEEDEGVQAGISCLEVQLDCPGNAALSPPQAAALGRRLCELAAQLGEDT
jgi:hypothetical protein